MNTFQTILPDVCGNSTADGAPVYFNNKGTSIAYDELFLLMLHSFVHYEAVVNTRETVLCIFNHIF